MVKVREILEKEVECSKEQAMEDYYVSEKIVLTGDDIKETIFIDLDTENPEYIRTFLKEEDVSVSTIEKMWNKVSELIRRRFDLEFLDYMLHNRYDSYEYYLATEHNDFAIRALVNTGGSEGIYLDVSLISCENGQSVKLVTLKTLFDEPIYYQKMGEISGYLTYVIETYYRVNQFNSYR